MKTEMLATPAKTQIACLSLPRLLSVGNLNAATACFALKACLLTPDATAIHSRQHIRPVLAQLIARRVRIEVAHEDLIVAGDVAFARQRWLVNTTGVGESRFEQTLNPAFVLRQIEGRWKLSIAALWGWAGDCQP
jgi:ketosteroid isomerase-like protein